MGSWQEEARASVHSKHFEYGIFFGVQESVVKKSFNVQHISVALEIMTKPYIIQCASQVVRLVWCVHLSRWDLCAVCILADGTGVQCASLVMRLVSWWGLCAMYILADETCVKCASQVMRLLWSLGQPLSYICQWNSLETEALVDNCSPHDNHVTKLSARTCLAGECQ